jgi:hypothetical protein
MSENNIKDAGHTDVRIYPNDENEAKYVHSLFPRLYYWEVVEAIKKYGPARESIMNHLQDMERRQLPR